MKTSRLVKTTHSPKKFVLRLPPSVHEKIGLAAKQHRRSMNAEIIRHLERALPSSPTDPKQPLPADNLLFEEDYYLVLFRALPSHKRNALCALLENSDDS